MNYRTLGNTGIRVSRLCFGSLTLGPLQANLSIREGSAVIRSALEKGVNFIDTSHFYKNYPHIREAIKNGFRETVIASKAYAYTKPEMRNILYNCLREIDRDYIDLFLLHEQESAFTIKGHWEAFEFLLEAKQKGFVRAVGISTHNVEGVRAAALLPEMDVIHPLINRAGVGIKDGSVEDMLDVISLAYSTGKGLYGMKALGGGNLIEDKLSALQFAANIKELSSIAVGMQNKDEVRYNTSFFAGEEIPPGLEDRLKKSRRRLHIEEWCTGCGQCVTYCSAGALAVEGDRAQVDEKLCRLCGYCGAACPEFCIKII